MRTTMMRKTTWCAAMIGFATAAMAAQDDAAASRLAELIRVEDRRIDDAATWKALEDASIDAAWKERVALAKRRVTIDPFEAPPPVEDAAALWKAYASEHDDVAALECAAHDLARARAKLPSAAKELLVKRLRFNKGEIAAFTARALAKVEGAGVEEATAITAAFLEGGTRVAQIDRLRALAAMPAAAGPARAAILAAVKTDDPHLRRTAFETLAALAPSLEDRDRAGLAKLASAAIDADPVDDVRAAAVGAYAVLDRSAFEGDVARFRLASPWNVRAAAASKLGLYGFGAGAWGSFVRDPDRRVRQALLEAVAAEVAASATETRHRSIDAIFKVGMSQLLGDAPPRLGDDPVDVGLRAQLLKRLLDAKVEMTDVEGFLTAAARALPSHEVECAQYVLGLAEARALAAPASLAARDALQTFADSPEIDLRRRARKALVKLGIDPRPYEAPPDAAGTDYASLAARALDPKPLRARVKTDRGEIVLRLFPDLAPLNVDNFSRLAKLGFYDGVLFHRVVPGFVAQAGCPRGDGYGGPGHTVRCEISDRTYRRGTLGMALAGKDTGGSQWFITHRWTPHLDGKYTVFGEVESGWDALDALVPGDRILRIAIE